MDWKAVTQRRKLSSDTIIRTQWMFVLPIDIIGGALPSTDLASFQDS